MGNIKYLKAELFPTTTIKIDYSEEFNREDQEEMVKDIDHLIDINLYESPETHPLYQTKIILFNEDRPKIWQKLKRTFYHACYFYLEQVPDFSNHKPDTLNPIDSNAWGFKSWGSLNKKQNNNPIHTHNPAFLSGVFYLKVPDSKGAKSKKDAGGTSFFDPRGSFASSNKSLIMDPTAFSWVIFPGWLPHNSCPMDCEDPRYVVAANMYVSPFSQLS